MLATRNDGCSLTEQLGREYLAFQRAAKLPKRLAMQASPPLLVAPHARWGSARVRVLVVGQETLRWQYDPAEIGGDGVPILNFNQFSQAEHGVGAMWAMYRWYALGRAYPKMNSPFWRGFRSLCSEIVGCADSALWTNVFKVNVRGSVMKNCKAKEREALRRAQHGLLREEIRILGPEVVVFLSGPQYDATLRYEFPDLEIQPFSRQWPETTLGVLRAEGLPARCVRTFHPEYLQRSNQLGLLGEVSRWARR